MTLPVDEFLRRFLLHILPSGFVRIRHFGLMAHRRRGVSLPLCLQLLAKSGRVRGAADNDGTLFHLQGSSGTVRTVEGR